MFVKDQSVRQAVEPTVLHLTTAQHYNKRYKTLKQYTFDCGINNGIQSMQTTGKWYTQTI